MLLSSPQSIYLTRNQTNSRGRKIDQLFGHLGSENEAQFDIITEDFRKMDRESLVYLAKLAEQAERYIKFSIYSTYFYFFLVVTSLLFAQV